MYKDIKSKFIKERIKKTSWKRREYIECLVRIEDLALGRSFGMSTGHAWMNLPVMYPKEWQAIWQELNPKGYKRWNDIERKAFLKEEAEDRQIAKEEALEKQRQRKEWKGAGGLD